MNLGYSVKLKTLADLPDLLDLFSRIRGQQIQVLEQSLAPSILCVDSKNSNANHIAPKGVPERPKSLRPQPLQYLVLLSSSPQYQKTTSRQSNTPSISSDRCDTVIVARNCGKPLPDHYKFLSHCVRRLVEQEFRGCGGEEGRGEVNADLEVEAEVFLCAVRHLPHLGDGMKNIA